jgi:alkaline phosphatase D
MPNYAVWDDHDYGPNDADKSYILKEASREVFMKYWANPSYGLNGQGIYSKVTWNDVDIFMLDDRWFRSDDSMPDSIDGQPNKNKKMFGDEQMEWLKNSLLFSNKLSETSFRIIATGSQVLNAYSPYDCFRHFPVEFNELINFIKENHINGVLFLTGDRHHSEIIQMDRNEAYPLYDITVSPFTSSVAKTRGEEQNNPTRIGKEIDEQNYARFSVTGKGEQRELTINFIGVHGENLYEWRIKKSELLTK